MFLLYNNMPGDEIFKLVFSLLIAAIVIWQLSSVPGFLPKAEIGIIAGLSVMVFTSGFFSVFNKLHK